MSFEIKPTGTATGWANVLHVGLGGDNSVYGDRIPGIWMYGTSTAMHIGSAISGNQNAVTTTNDIPQNVWTKVVIRQARQADGSYKFLIAVDDDLIKEVTNTDPREFTNVKVSQN